MSFDFQRLSAPERLLWSNGVTEPGHIELEALANLHGAMVFYRPLEGCEARLVVNGDRGAISINSTSTEGRQRFSLAHELAHWICDRKTGSFLCAKDDIGPQNAVARSVEADANSFASQLILPSYLVDPRIQSKPVTLDIAGELAKDFNASLTAAAIKLVNRSEMPAFVVCHNQSRSLWFRRSAQFPSEFFIARELHQDTDAFQIAFGGTAGLTRPKREPANRWFSGRDAYKLEVTSQSVRLPDATVLSLISLVTHKSISKAG